MDGSPDRKAEASQIIVELAKHHEVVLAVLYELLNDEKAAARLAAVELLPQLPGLLSFDVAQKLSVIMWDDVDADVRGHDRQDKRKTPLKAPGFHSCSPLLHHGAFSSQVRKASCAALSTCHHSHLLQEGIIERLNSRHERQRAAAVKKIGATQRTFLQLSTANVPPIPPARLH